MGEQDVVREITSLVDERRRFEQWLAALDARRATTPQHVFDRVRADYTARLEGVLAKLGEFMPRLRELETALVERLEGVHGGIREVEDHRAESELRSHVGELSEEAWGEVQAETGNRLAALGEEREGIERELASVRELISGTTPAGMDAVAEEAPASPESPAEEPAPPVATVAEPEEEPAVAASPRVSQPVDQAAVDAEPLPLIDDYELPAAPDGAAPAQGGGEPTKRQLSDSLPWLEPIPYRDTAENVAAVPAEPVPTEPEPAAPMSADAPRATESQPPRMSGAVERPIDDSLGIFVHGSATEELIPSHRTSKETPLAAHVPANTPMVLRSEGPVAKTLKCSECGSMNVPTEWYCERCGAELAAL